MPAPYSAVIAGLGETWAALGDLLDDLDDTDWATPTGCPGWSVQDQVSHIVGVERMLAGEPEPRHDLPADLPHVRNDFGRRVERPVDYRRAWAPARVRAEYDEIVSRRTAALRAATDEELAAPVESPFGTIPLGAFLGIRLVDCYAHEQDVRRATGRRGHLDGVAPREMWRLSARALARDLPVRVPELTEHVVVLAPQPGDAVAIEAGRVVTEVIRAPSVRLTGAFDEMVALLGGRSDAQPERISVLGDQALGRVLLGALTITP